MEEIDLYLRKSKIVRDEDARDLTSIKTQEELGRAWADRNDYRVREVWIDNLSAWSDVERPKFDKALGAIMLGEVKALWCFALDRFTRKGVDDIGPILGRARVLFDYEGLDSSNERDRRWIIDRAEQAREYSNRLSYNIKTTKSSQQRAGKWLGRAPFGLEIADPKTRKLKHSDKWGVVYEIFEQLAEGMSGRGLCIHFNEELPERIPSPGGGFWQSSTISRIIHNPVYEGWQVTNQRGLPGPDTIFRTPDGHRVSVFEEGYKPIPRELAEKARAAMRGHFPLQMRKTPNNMTRTDSGLIVPEHASEAASGPIHPRAGKPKTVHVLTGLTRCHGCAGALPSEGRSHVCSHHKIGKPCPEPTSAMRTSLETHVRTKWIERLCSAEDSDPLLVKVAQRYAMLKHPDDNSAANEAVAELKAAEAGIERIAQQMRDGFFEPPFDAHLPQLQEEARAALIIAKAKVAKLTPKETDIGFLRDRDEAGEAWDDADRDLRRQLVRLAVSRIWVKKAPGHRRGFDGDSRVIITFHGDPEYWPEHVPKPQRKTFTRTA
ncbi:recombinase family protein [Streptomyces sp. BPTC-684]|uniref:recombinase family protein n=1 Tax=Streptomyces sp. BPTC-684 TaxID=3043734 RepID=UPI0024B05475|nr:recombinase family protein [Streptomyces sp. BPTC-684]WHM37404.1 recombinase family protein [Streptomyces sp. BPTC-684]